MNTVKRMKAIKRQHALLFGWTDPLSHYPHTHSLKCVKKWNNRVHTSVIRVMCLGCGGISARAELQKRFLALNPDWSAQAGGVAPDGDVFIEDEQVLHFRVPSCEACGGILKPEVTFFGDSVSKAKVQFVHDRLAESDAVLVVGSSLQVGLGETYEASCHLRHGSSGFLCFNCFFSVCSLGVFRLQVFTGSRWQEDASCHPEHRAHEGRPPGRAESERPLWWGAVSHSTSLTVTDTQFRYSVSSWSKNYLRFQQITDNRYGPPQRFGWEHLDVSARRIWCYYQSNKKNWPYLFYAEQLNVTIV